MAADLAASHLIDFKVFLAPQVGLEPTTLRLTAECSAIELLRSAGHQIVHYKGSRERGPRQKSERKLRVAGRECEGRYGSGEKCSEPAPAIR